MILVSLWAWLALFGLLVMTFQDFFNDMNIDDRRNFLMLGLTISLLTVTAYPWWYVISIIVVGLALSFFLAWKKALGGADINTLWWCYYGFALIGIHVMLFFFIILTVLTLIYAGILRLKGRKGSKYPYYVLITISFTLTAFAYGLLGMLF
jgi:hypothetical protein